MGEFLEKACELLQGVASWSGAPITTFILAALFGHRIAAIWAERQKKRELELALANSFYASYGEFSAVWKDWNYTLHEQEPLGEEFQKRRQALRERACRAEGAIEAALLKIAAERFLDLTTQGSLGVLRQAFKALRRNIEAGVKVSYDSCEHRQYLEFKRLATLVGVLLAKSGDRQPTEKEAKDSFIEITHNKHEITWKELAKRTSK